MRMRVFVAVLSLMVAPLLAQQPQQPPQDPQRPPVFRAGAHYVRVDVYPVDKDGQPIRGLKPEDFELLEDGKPQEIDKLEFIEHAQFTPTFERRDPNSQRDGFELAKDPNFRVFVLYLDIFSVDVSGSHRVRRPLVDFLNRMIGPQDLFGVLTPIHSVKDLMLGQLTLQIEDQLAAAWDWGHRGDMRRFPEELELEAAFPVDGAGLVGLKRLDQVYADLEELIEFLGELRDERKNIVFFSDYLPSPQSPFSRMASDRRGNVPDPTRVGVDAMGKLTTGSRGRGDIDLARAEAERTRLRSIDFDRRFRDLLRAARQANVSFYTVRPGGLDVGIVRPDGGMGGYSLMNEGVGNLRTLADETDGVAIQGSNDLRPGLNKIASDLSSHYVLGYYTSNATWNGGTRRITVKLKSNGERVRARREYRAPTKEEMEMIAAAGRADANAPAAPSAEDSALGALKRLRPAAPFHAYATHIGSEVAVIAEIAAAEIEGGRWKSGADVSVMLVGADDQTRSVTARIEPGARGTAAFIPVDPKTGPWKATIRIKSDAGSEFDTVAVAVNPAGALVGEPMPHRAASAAVSPWKPAAALHFRRTERVQLRWPVLGAAVERAEARLLDKNGQPLNVPVNVKMESGARPAVVTDVNLAPLNIGEYLVELTAHAGEKTQRKLLALRVANAR
jgi:VWFA-related protein